ncbi:hypothetical protein CDV49_01065 [Haematobacter genomosp. 1]|uniref:Uncharacterized protein n=2 Tax=Haematobacter genomosp. 1 TaxID=366618 RepID=A0A212AG43_9RHOB|nr:hypothetical protein CDV49_01065 [Haematobacter genomosp. 1]
MDGGISVGNIISWLVVIVGVGTAWGAMTVRTDETRTDVLDIRSELIAVRTAVNKLEISDARNGERYESLSKSMTDVKNEQRETNALLRQFIQPRPQK